MDVVWDVVVVEVDDRDNMELGMENIEDIMDGSHNFLPTLLPRLVLGLRWPRFPWKGCVPITLRWMCTTLKF